ncbi:MAG: porin [Candidatus Brocadia sp.]|nr:porin [Candidatus Brocadia sp.]MDG6027532.1 porin [Candidatus Brocadia sp.]
MRNRWFQCGVSLAMVFCVLCFTGKAQDTIAQEVVQDRDAFKSETDELKNQIKRMEEAFLVQQKMMKQMEILALSQQEQIKELKVRVESMSEKPVTVAREEIKEEVKQEVKQEVGNYLASDEARKKLRLGLPGKYEPVNGYYLPDREKASIGFQTRDGNYSLNIGFRTQMRFTYKDKDEDFDESDITDIDLRRARVCFAGNIYSKDLFYNVELDADSFEANLRDYFIWWTPAAAEEAFSVKAGYFKVPANRQWNSSGFKLLLMDRSIASDNFRQDRDYGVDLYGKPFDGHMEYHAAVFRGAGQNPSKAFGKDENTNNELMYVLAARYYPFGWCDANNLASGWNETDMKYEENFKAVIGASFVYNAKENDKKLEDTNSAIGDVDLGVRYRGFTWDSEYYIRENDPEDDGDSVTSDGFYTQAGYFVLPRKLELAARYSMLDPDEDVRDDVQTEYTVGVNYYIRGNRQKVQTDVGHFVTETTGEDKDENRIRLQYQMIF